MAYHLKDFVDLTDEQASIISLVECDPELTKTFYLTGGTLLKARGIVPRHSNDLDFFTFPSIDGRTYLAQMRRMSDLLKEGFGAEHIIATDRGFLHQPSGTVIDGIADGVPKIDDFVLFGNLHTASMKDCAAGKASALCSRDEIKDYIDVAFLMRQEKWLLRDLENFAEQKFGLGTITEEKLLTELLAKQSLFAIPSDIFLRDAEKNKEIIREEISHLIESTSL